MTLTQLHKTRKLGVTAKDQFSIESCLILLPSQMAMLGNNNKLAVNKDNLRSLLETTCYGTEIFLE